MKEDLSTVIQMGMLQAHLPGQVAKTAMRLEREWIEAVIRRDTVMLDRLLAEGFIITTPAGVITKAQCLENLRNGELRLDSIICDDTTQHDYEDEAVVSGTLVIKGGYGGRDISGQYRYRYTEGSVRWSGSWPLVNCWQLVYCEAHRIL